MRLTIIVAAASLFAASFAMTSTAETVLWSEDWETEAWNDDWHADQGVWEVGTPTAGPANAFAGERCAATVIGGNYGANVDSRLIRHTSFVVPPASENPRLRFRHWYSISDYDYGQVQIRVTGTVDWIDLPEARYTATGSGVWTRPSIDLSAYAGETVQIAFYFYATRYSIFSSESTGWYIDDVAIVTDEINFNNPESWETGLGDWLVDLGTWEIGAPSSGPAGAFAGDMCAATVLAGNYASTVNSRLVSPVFEVSAADKNPRLRFRHWYSISDYDYGQVQIRVITPDSTSAWTLLPEGNFTGNSSGVWTYPYISLSEFADNMVQICFYFHAGRYSIFSSESTGWYIDDVTIEPVIETPGVTVTSPNGGEVLIGGDIHAITWDCTLVTMVDISISMDNGATWEHVAEGLDAMTGSYDWTVPDIDSQECLIMVTNADDADVCDSCDSTFRIETRTAVHDSPLTFRVSAPYPNPFNPSTTIGFTMPSRSPVRIEVRDITGRLIAVPCDRIFDRGVHDIAWNGRDADGLPVASGVYLFTVRAGGHLHRGKLMLLR